MKNTIYLTASLIFLTLTIYIIKPLLNNNSFPSVAYVDLKNEKIDVSKIDLNDKETFLFYVNPTCNSCDRVIEFLKDLDSKKNNRIIICSYVSGINYSKYKKKFNLKKEDIFLIDKKNTLIYDFNIGISYSLPIVLKFDKNGHKI